ncbi:MAG: hypothetical protein NTX48_06130 [Planctomycetales bacterium]|nr:hypothetical protein [Planctomycetales bacterium]
MLPSIPSLREAMLLRFVSPRRRRAARGRIDLCTEPVEQRLLLSGTEPPTMTPPDDDTTDDDTTDDDTTDNSRCHDNDDQYSYCSTDYNHR